MRSMGAALWILCAGLAAAQTPVAAQTPASGPELELLGGPEGDPVGAATVGASAVPQLASSPARTRRALAPLPDLARRGALGRAAPGLNGPAGAVGVRMGVGYCWQAPAAVRAALTLELCDGEEDQRVRLENGALLIGEAGARMVRLPSGAAAGAPLIVDDSAAAEPDGPEFEYIRRGKLMRVAGTDLCVAPAETAAGGAPLRLDSCTSPSAGDLTHLRATFVMSWR